MDETSRDNPVKRISKLRGKVVTAGFVNQAIVIQAARHHRKKVRRLTVMAETEILAGHTHVTLHDVLVGDWVYAHFVEEEDHVVLRRLRIPRGLGSSHPIHPETARLDNLTACLPSARINS